MTRKTTLTNGEISRLCKTFISCAADQCQNDPYNPFRLYCSSDAEVILETRHLTNDQNGGTSIVNRHFNEGQQIELARKALENASLEWSNNLKNALHRHNLQGLITIFGRVPHTPEI
ncbi:MAG: hypothetical protein KDJ26_06765 [Alphaproteobacteria bacterium]|nr:hypothetical protein [Alphaproteobacteria bacterium]MCB9985494.1 hypothetical protein [Micavibrio sp.]HPQ50198.1 hypothetical protein [Alphaproteobacteria bacterium]